MTWKIAAGAAVIELAKMTGITPAGFTFNGRYELDGAPCAIFVYWIGIFILSLFHKGCEVNNH